MKTSELRTLLAKDTTACCTGTELTEADKNYVMDLETDLEAAKNFISEFIDLNQSLVKRDLSAKSINGKGFLEANLRLDILHTIVTAQRFLEQWQPIDASDRAILYAD